MTRFAGRCALPRCGPCDHDLTRRGPGVHPARADHQRAPRARDLDHTDQTGARLGNLLLKPAPLSVGQQPLEPVEMEIGWHLRPHAWGHGNATEAATLVAADGFARGLDRIIAVTHPDNHASQAVCRRLGMHHLGLTSRYYDTSCEQFELTPPD